MALACGSVSIVSRVQPIHLSFGAPLLDAAGWGLLLVLCVSLPAGLCCGRLVERPPFVARLGRTAARIAAFSLAGFLAGALQAMLVSVPEALWLRDDASRRVGPDLSTLLFQALFFGGVGLVAFLGASIPGLRLLRRADAGSAGIMTVLGWSAIGFLALLLATLIALVASLLIVRSIDGGRLF